jgi:MGT family glycosyltransferase
MMPKRGPVGWLFDRISPIVVSRLFAPGQAALAVARNALGLPAIKSPLAYLQQVDPILVLTSPAFEFPARFPRNVRIVGPILDDPATDEATARWTTTGTDRPLVLVSFSTTFQGHGRMVSQTVEALKDMPVCGLVTVGPTLDPRDYEASSNVSVVRSVPHSFVLPHASAVVTHAGHGTVIRALAHGVPLVCMPIGRDQPGNAARVVSRGAGVRLKPSADAGAIRAAIDRVIQEPRFRDAAQGMARAIGDGPKPSDAIDELESLAR